MPTYDIVRKMPKWKQVFPMPEGILALLITDNAWKNVEIVPMSGGDTLCFLWPEDIMSQEIHYYQVTISD